MGGGCPTLGGRVTTGFTSLEVPEGVRLQAGPEEFITVRAQRERAAENWLGARQLLPVSKEVECVLVD